MTQEKQLVGLSFGSIAAHLSGQVMALDFDRAQSHLLMPYPDGAVNMSYDMDGQTAVMSGPVEVPRGERFAVSRRVAVMPVRGILTPDAVALERWLGWATYQGIEHACAELAANDDVSAIILDVNSPGGLVLGMDGGAQAIAALAAVKPVHVIVNPLAASAAYFLASQASDITMTPGSEAGSIGTMRMSAWPVEPNHLGEQEGIHLSSHARAKYPNPTGETGLAEIQRSLDEAESIFLDAVAAGRKLDRATLPARLSVTGDDKDGGAVFRVAECIKRGLADKEETRAAFYERVFAEYAPPPAGGASRAMSASAGAKARLAQAISTT